MDAAGLVRAARRQAGLGQAPFAGRAKVSARALGALEAGRSDPSWSTVARLVAAADLQLTLVPRVPAASAAMLFYLQASTSDRLAWSLLGRRAAACVRRGAWGDLGRLGRHGQVRLDGLAAAGVWLPDHAAPAPLPVVLHPDERCPPTGKSLGRDGGLAEQFPHLAVTVQEGVAPPGGVPVAVPMTWVLVPPPLLLAAHPACGAQAEPLPVAAALLHDDVARDDGLRRVPAHRDPDERREVGEVQHRKQHHDRQLPNALDSRAWRLRGSCSLASWLIRHPQGGRAAP